MLRVLLFSACVVCAPAAASARPYGGSVSVAGVAVPGAVVTAIRGDTAKTTTSDRTGRFVFADLSDGEWTLRAEMPGFAPAVQSVQVTGDVQPVVLSLTLLEFSQMRVVPAADVQAVSSRAAAAPSQPAPASSQRADVPSQPATSPATPANRRAPASPLPSATAPIAPQDAGDAAGAGDAADGLLINGSVNNSAASPFSQFAAFGNNRRNGRSLYSGGLGLVFGNSAWDARPYAFAGAASTKPSYSDAQIVGAFGGPVRIRGLRNRPTLFIGAQQLVAHNTTTQSALVPTDAERQGDFSRTATTGGGAVIVDPQTGAPFPGNRVPANRISPQATALLQYYPRANVVSAGFNLQAPTLLATNQRSLQSRVSYALNNRDSVFVSVAYQRTLTDTTTIFGFNDSARLTNKQLAAQWSHRFSPFLTIRARYTYSAQGGNTTPYFAWRTNVSGLAGVRGNNQDPVNWGPPSLTFSSGLATLSSPQASTSDAASHGWLLEGIRTIGRHTVTFGGGWTPQHVNLLGQQDARGSFSFTGTVAGSDFADFLLGLPATSSIAVGNPDKFLIGHASSAYATDDWRVSPALTVNGGVRWEFESPMHERDGRLANLALAPGFSRALVTTGVDGLSGGALLTSDYRGVQPRIGVAWRPVPGSSVVIRGGYGIYRNTNVYPTLATLLAQQPPFSRTFALARSAQYPLTLADGFPSTGDALTNTFAIDPDFRVGYAHTWSALAQRDLPGSLTVSGTYFGTRGMHLIQELLPNTYPPAVVTPCPSCPVGFTYLTSGGHSLRNAGQLQIRRRLRNGLTASAIYTLAKATDDASAFVPSGIDATSTGIAGATIAQDWRNLAAEESRSAFDRRHLFVAELQYTTGQGVAGGALMDGTRGRWFKGWTVTSQLTMGSGLPVTPIYLRPVAGTGVVGTIRGSLTGIGGSALPDQYYANPAAYAPPAPDSWGTAPRNSITGPAQFGVNASLGRAFAWGDRSNIEWRLEATNVLNSVTYAAITTVVGSPQFGLPNRANTMRKLQLNARYRF